VVAFAAVHANVPSSFWSTAAPAWLAGIGTIVVAIVAIFNEWVKRLFIHPILKLHVRVARPDAERTLWSPLTEPIGVVYYFRLGVTNVGRAAARDVQLYVASVHRIVGTKPEAVERFTPMNLRWAHVRTATIPVLLPDMPPRYCDFAHISHPGAKRKLSEDLPGVPNTTPVLALDLEVEPGSLGHLLEPGEYYLALKLVATNHPPDDHTIYVKFPGLWYLDEESMFRRGIEIREVYNALPRPPLCDSF
jgi:hypothetical protein